MKILRVVAGALAALAALAYVAILLVGFVIPTASPMRRPGIDFAGGLRLDYALAPDAEVADPDAARRQAAEVLARRVDALAPGARAFVSGDLVAVELPGTTEEGYSGVREALGREGRLELRMIADSETAFLQGVERPPGLSLDSEQFYARGRATETWFVAASDDGAGRDALDAWRQGVDVPDGRELAVGERSEWTDDGPTSAWRTYLLEREAAVTGANVVDASLLLDPQTGQPTVGVTLDAVGRDAFAALTGANVHRRLAIVVDGRVMSAPVIQGAIDGGELQITLGETESPQETLAEAESLVAALRAGALPARLVPANERLVAPALSDGERTAWLAAPPAAVVLVTLLAAAILRRRARLVPIPLLALLAAGAWMTIAGPTISTTYLLGLYASVTLALVVALIASPLVLRWRAVAFAPGTGLALAALVAGALSALLSGPAGTFASGFFGAALLTAPLALLTGLAATPPASGGEAAEPA